jgi:hypothetical protein
MANHYRKMVVHPGHLEASPQGPSWIVLWDTTKRPDGNWSTVRTDSEASALERAAHFVKLGFVVHAVKDPSGTVVMDAASVAGRFGRVKSAPMLSDEDVARSLARGFVDGRQVMPGQMLGTGTLRSRLLPRGLGQGDFERAVSFARDHGWVSVADDILTLTQAGYAVATA